MTISTLNLNTSARTTIQRIQLELGRAQKETSTLRHADVGRTLGGETAAAVSFRNQATAFDSQIQSNKTITSNLDLMDDSLTTVSAGAELMKTTLISALAAKDVKTLGIAVTQARSSLEQMAGALNLSVGGQSFFGGAAVDQKPVDEAAGSTATQAGFRAFVLAATGASDASKVTKTQMDAYLGGGFTDGASPPVTHSFQALFAEPKWSQNWSNASDTQMTGRISPTETITTSLSANDAAFRKLAASYSMIADLDLAGLSEDVRSAVLTKAREDVQVGIDGATRIQAEVGFRLGRVKTASELMTAQMDTATKSYATLEDVDPAEVALRVNNLLTQLEATAKVTSRIQALNILDYL